MFIVIQTLEEDYIDLNVQKIDYVQYYNYHRSKTFYRIYIGHVAVDISEEVYSSTLEPVLYPED
jgi:hypothetical protein